MTVVTDSTAGATPNANVGDVPIADATKADGTQGQPNTTLLAAEPAHEGEVKPELNEDGTPKVITKAEEPVVPEAYTFDMPEGVELDSVAAGEFSVVAKDLKLTQEQASKLVPVAVAMQQRAAEKHAATVKEWSEAVTTDKELGGEKLAATLATCRKTVDTFGTPALKSLFESTGLGNHPEFVRFTHKIGLQLSEGSFIRGGNTSPADQSTKESRMYPTMVKTA